MFMITTPFCAATTHKRVVITGNLLRAGPGRVTPASDVR
jgi:hypothetical protein